MVLTKNAKKLKLRKKRGASIERYRVSNRYRYRWTWYRWYRLPSTRYRPSLLLVYKCMTI